MIQFGSLSWGHHKWWYSNVQRSYPIRIRLYVVRFRDYVHLKYHSFRDWDWNSQKSYFDPGGKPGFLGFYCKCVGGFLKWWYPHFTPQVLIIFSRKTPGFVRETHHLRKPLCRDGDLSHLLTSLDHLRLHRPPAKSQDSLDPEFHRSQVEGTQSCSDEAEGASAVEIWWSDGLLFFLFSPLFGADVQFDQHMLSMGWLKPPTSFF